MSPRKLPVIMGLAALAVVILPVHVLGECVAPLYNQASISTSVSSSSSSATGSGAASVHNFQGETCSRFSIRATAVVKQNGSTEIASDERQGMGESFPIARGTASVGNCYNSSISASSVAYLQAATGSGGEQCWQGPPPPSGGGGGGDQQGGDECPTQCTTPIIIDLARDGFALTSAHNGVAFDIEGNGTLDRLSWTSAHDDDSFLWLDENVNGIVDNGGELFGGARHANGFIKLAQFDTLDGGNGDGRIDENDGVWSLLQLWTDSNHDGISQVHETSKLSANGITSIELSYVTIGMRDKHGNLFRYRAQIHHVGESTNGASKLYDVIFVRDTD